jgi:galactokinase
MLERLFNLKTDKVTKALRCQKAEHDFAGMPCGIMDQFISAVGEDGHLVLIDCRSNKPTLVPFGSGETTPLILVTNSKVKHKLTGSEYPDRVKQCQEAVKALQKKYATKVKSLRDADQSMLQEVRGNMSEVAFKRAKHVIDENQRVLDTVEALKRKDYAAAGRYMTASHDSLRDDYEVSCEEIDFLQKCALGCQGVYGSRMTGGGFGGCTVTLVDRNAVKSLEHFLRESYWKQYHKQCEFIAAIPSAGAGVIDLSLYNDQNNNNNRSNNNNNGEDQKNEGGGGIFSALPAPHEIFNGSSLHTIGSLAVVIGVVAVATFAFVKRRN